MRREWVSWDPVSNDYEPSLEDPGDDSAVPVVTVLREGNLVLPAEIRNHLWDHPVLSEQIARSEGQTPRDRFYQTLNWTNSIAEEHQLHDWGEIPLLAEQDGPDQFAASCVMVAFGIRIALKSIETNSPLENLDGVEDDKDKAADPTSFGGVGGWIWSLLNESVELGRMLERYSASRDRRVDVR